MLVTATGLILILMAIGVLMLGTQAGAAADIAIEQALGYIYQTKVEIDRVVFLPHKSAIAVQGLTIHNPPPFKDVPAIDIGEVFVQMEPASLLTAKPIIGEVLLKAAKFSVRYEPGHGTNLGKLDENAARLRSNGSTGGSVLVSKQYAIKKFHSEEASLDVAASFVPQSNLNLTISPFTIENLSSGKPVTTAEICTLFIQSIFTEALSMRGLLQPVADKFNDELQRLRERDGDISQ